MESKNKYSISPTHRVAVGAYIFDSSDRMLLLLRRDAPNIYAPPGGRLKPDENPIDGIKREIMEEASIEVDILEFTFVWFGKIISDAPPFIGIDFIAKAKSYDVLLSDEHKDFIWATKYQIEHEKITTIENEFGYKKETILKAFEIYAKFPLDIIHKFD